MLNKISNPSRFFTFALCHMHKAIALMCQEETQMKAALVCVKAAKLFSANAIDATDAQKINMRKQLDDLESKFLVVGLVSLLQ